MIVSPSKAYFRMSRPTREDFGGGEGGGRREGGEGGEGGGRREGGEGGGKGGGGERDDERVA